jgi:hypothetical protein
MLIGSSFIAVQCPSTFVTLPIEPEAADQDLALLSSNTRTGKGTIGSLFS